MSEPLIQILLSTYNGALYLQEQLDSIYNQSHKNWEILVRDDGSTDTTLELIEKNIAKYPEKFKIVKDDNGGSSTKSFMSLLKYTKAEYIAFSDQDDVWKPEKLTKSLKLLQQAEKCNKKALVFTDMTIVDEKLKSIEHSFFQSQKFNSDWLENEYNIYAQSMAAGCTMLFTKKLAEGMAEIEPSIFQHDHWMLINAKRVGKIKFLNEPTMLYRQHSLNAVGSHSVGLRYFIGKIAGIQAVLERWKYLNKTFEEVRVSKLFLAKLKLNLKRLFKSSAKNYFHRLNIIK